MLALNHTDNNAALLYNVHVLLMPKLKRHCDTEVIQQLQLHQGPRKQCLATLPTEVEQTLHLWQSSAGQSSRSVLSWFSAR